MKKPSRSKGRKAMKPQPVAAPALPQARGGALDPSALDVLVGIDSDQHNETLVEDR